MPRLLSKLRSMPGVAKRARLIAAVLFGLAAATSWWIVIEQGPSPARVIAAVATTVVVLLDVFLPNRKRRLRR